MEVLILQAFVSLMLVGGSLLLFVFSWRQKDHEHADRLALLPADHDDEGPLAKHAPATELAKKETHVAINAEDSHGIRG
jgi:hypothetical protein